MIIDGRAIADTVYASLSKRVIARQPVLGVIVGSNDPVIDSFVRIKERAAARLNVSIIRKVLSRPFTTDDVVRAVVELSEIVDGVIVQLPLPEGIDVDRVLSAIPKEKDIDGISPIVDETSRLVRAPVAGAVEEILRSEKVVIERKKAFVVGYGRLVGKPVASLLMAMKADVRVVSKDVGSLDQLKDADIVVLGAGEPGFIRPKHLKEGVVLIDAGTSESSGRVVGDADPTCADIASVFTPVPGGVGPIAVAMIFKNLFDLVDRTQPEAERPVGRK